MISEIMSSDPIFPPPPAHERPPHHSSYFHQPLGISAALLTELSKPFYRKLLDEAKTAINSNNEMAVVLCQAASEIATESAITSLLTARNNGDLVDPILDLFRANDICNDGLRGVFVALSGDNPSQRPFWQTLKAHHKRRNGVVHRGDKVSPSDAVESVTVVEEYVQYLEALLGRVIPRST